MVNRVFRSKLFIIANLLKKRYKMSLSESLKIAWKAMKLKLYFYKGAIEFSYFKKDGSLRQAFGTLRNIEYKLKGDDKFKFDILTFRYFDLEKQDFRAFKIKNLISFNPYFK